MRHSIQLETFCVRLRPVRLDDAAFIVWVRNLDHAKGNVGDSATDTAAQEAWLQKYFDRDGDHYFIVETLAGTALGTYGIYDIRDSTGESGRWIIRPGVPAAIPSAIGAFDVAFEKLHLREVRVKTVSTNTQMLSLIVKFGCVQTHVEPASQIIDGKPVDAVHFVLTPENWAEARARLLPFAERAERQVRQWELTHQRNQQ